MIGTRAMVYKDFSEVIGTLGEKNRVHFDYTQSKEIQKNNFQKELDRKRRAALMSDPKMLYIFAKGTNFLHDRSCDCVKHIEDADFQMISEIPDGYVFCEECYIKSILRKRIESTKNLDICEKFLRKMNVKAETLRLLIIENEAHINMINERSLWIKVREDEWIIEKPKDSCKRLLHNNYIIDKKTGKRIFNGGFHIQKDGKNNSLHDFVECIISYDYDCHKIGMKLNLEAIARQIDIMKKHGKLSASNKLIDYMFMHQVPKNVKAELLELFKKIYNEEQVYIIKKGFKMGLTCAQLKMFVHPGYSAKQMKEIYSGFVLGLSNDQIQKYGRYILYPYEMKIRKWRFWWENVKKKVIK